MCACGGRGGEGGGGFQYKKGVVHGSSVGCHHVGISLKQRKDAKNWLLPPILV